jgi:hypothetical protein
MSIFNFFPLDSGSATCIIPQTPYEQLGVSAVFPLVFFGWLLVVAAGHWAVLYARGKRIGCSDSTAARSFFVPYARTFVVLALSCYTQVTSSVIHYLQCVPVGSSRVVFSVPAIDCR